MISERVKRVFEHQNWILGPEVAELEGRIADYVGREYAVACASGADALYLALNAAGINDHCVVATTPFTFGATASAILRTGARLVFADIGQDLQIDFDQVYDLFRKNHKICSVVAVDLFGGMPDYKKAGFDEMHVLVEDAAQAFGSEYGSKKAGVFGNYGCFSFHPSKPLGAFGDAGMVVTDNAIAAHTIRTIRNHGQKSKYHYTGEGLNSRMDSIQAAAILDKLDGYEAELKRRRSLANAYRDSLPNLRHPIQTTETQNPSFSIYPVIFESTEIRERDKAALSHAGIWNRVYYPRSLHLEPAFAFMGHKKGDFPNAERASETILALPMDVTMDGIKQVIEILQGIPG